jgi:glucan phosphoethanolaminetransferase (alkaline phosphatase superfamily)
MKNLEFELRFAFEELVLNGGFFFFFFFLFSFFLFFFIYFQGGNCVVVCAERMPCRGECPVVSPRVSLVCDTFH